MGHGRSLRVTGARVPEGCWWGGTNPSHPWSKQPGSPPFKLPLLARFANRNPPKDKPVLSQCSIAPNSS